MPNRNQNVQWFSGNQPAVFLRQEYFDTLSQSPRKVDIVLRVDNIAVIAQSDLLENLARHPKVGRLIIFGLPTAQRGLIAARAAMLGIHLRFCETEEEAQVLLNKRRSRSFTDNRVM